MKTWETSSWTEWNPRRIDTTTGRREKTQFLIQLPICHHHLQILTTRRRETKTRRRPCPHPPPASLPPPIEGSHRLGSTSAIKTDSGYRQDISSIGLVRIYSSNCLPIVIANTINCFKSIPLNLKIYCRLIWPCRTVFDYIAG